MMFDQIVSLFWVVTSEHVPAAAGIVTAAIAVVQQYTGYGPKQLPARYQQLPAAAATVALCEWLAIEQHGATPAVIVAAAVAGIVAGAGSHVAHVTLQTAARLGGRK